MGVSAISRTQNFAVFSSELCGVIPFENVQQFLLKNFPLRP